MRPRSRFGDWCDGSMVFWGAVVVVCVFLLGVLAGTYVPCA